jgi:hypothetical protein
MFHRAAVEHSPALPAPKARAAWTIRDHVPNGPPAPAGFTADARDTDDDAALAAAVELARTTEHEPSLIGVSGHLLAHGRAPR